MSLLRRVLSLFTEAALYVVNREIESVSSRLAIAETELAEVVARKLGIPLCKVRVKIHRYADGSKLASMELKLGVSSNQLQIAQETLDLLVPTRRPNVRPPHPAVN